MSEALLQVQELSRHYGANRAVDNISFNLQRGQVLGFLGPNGAGKSTAMRMLAGVLAPDAGQISIGGIDLLDHPIQAKQLLGYVPERPPLYWDMTVDEQLYFSAHLHRVLRPNKQVAEIKERCGLTEVGRRLIGQLSKGYQQRTGIAQALLHQPQLLILDEPSASLDPLQAQAMRSLIGELAAERATLLSSHQFSEVEEVCSDVQIMHKGRLVCASTLAEVQQQGGLEAVFMRWMQQPMATLGTFAG